MRTRGQRLIRHLDKRLVLSRLFRFITLTAGVLVRGHVKVLIYRMHSREFKSIWTFVVILARNSVWNKNKQRDIFYTLREKIRVYL